MDEMKVHENIGLFIRCAHGFYNATTRNICQRTASIPSSCWQRLHFPYGCKGPTVYYFQAEGGLYVFRRDDESYLFEIGSTPMDAYCRAIGVSR